MVEPGSKTPVLPRAKGPYSIVSSVYLALTYTFVVDPASVDIFLMPVPELPSGVLKVGLAGLALSYLTVISS